MTVPRLFAIVLIFLASTTGWVALGGSVVHRSHFGERLTGEVARLWGSPQAQVAPSVRVEARRAVSETLTEERDGETVARRFERLEPVVQAVPLATSRVEVGLDLAHRRKGLLWYDTYDVAFRGLYRCLLPEDLGGEEPVVVVDIDFPSPYGVYDGFSLRVNGVEATPVDDLSEGAQARAPAKPGGEIEVEVAYRSRGLDVWSYRFAPTGVAQVRDFELAATTDFTAVDFPTGTLSPTMKERQGEGWLLVWRFEQMVTGDSLGIDLPNRLNPGPLAARITFFAPVSLLFFLAVFVVLGALRRVDLHPMNYFFLSGAFFAFHLLLAYLVDHVNVHLAFGIAAAVSVGLVASYLRLVAGARGALGLAVLSQTVFLVLFSYAFFFEGYTGLTVTLGAVLTLFLLMRFTARVDWGAVFRPGPAAREPS